MSAPFTFGQRSTHTQWVSCFNSSSAGRAAYVQRIYGSETEAALKAFDWAQVDVIYHGAMQGLNHTCMYFAKLVYRRSIMGGIFVDYPERTQVQNGRLINLGGPRGAERTAVWSWLEVMHSPSYGLGGGHSMGQGNLWMYVARGSGLWFNPGRVLILSDTFDLAVYLNLTKTYSARSPGSKSVLMQKGASF